MDSAYQLPNRVDSSKLCPLAHDLNNNISVILGRCELLGDVLQGNAAAKKHLRLIVEEARQMAARIAERPCQMAEERYKSVSHESSEAEGAGSLARSVGKLPEQNSRILP